MYTSLILQHTIHFYYFARYHWFSYSLKRTRILSFICLQAHGLLQTL